MLDKEKIRRKKPKEHIKVVGSSQDIMIIKIFFVKY